MKLLLFEKEEIHPDAITLLKSNNIEVIAEDSSFNADEIEALFIRSYTKATPEFLERFSKLKYIIRAGVGIENINAEECKRRGITIFNSPRSNSNAVAELVICYMLLLLRQVVNQMQRIHENKWRELSLMGDELKDKRVGVVGCGAIGQLVARKLHGMDVKEILGYDPFLTEDFLSSYSIRKVDMDTLFREADIITLHLPLLPETKNLVNTEKFSIMKNGVYIINTARGGIINENDLILAMKNGKVAGAALDVFENEPDLNKDLLELENLIATPHIGALTTEANRAMSVHAVENFLQHLSSK